MTRFLPALVLTGLFALLVLACDDSPPPSAVDDEGYLAVMCANLDRFSDAIQVETKKDAIAAVIEDFIDELQSVDPPADLRDFHQAFIDYLNDAVDDPTSPLVVAPPLPDDEARERLAGKEGSVAECREPSFFNSPQADR